MIESSVPYLQHDFGTANCRQAQGQMNFIMIEGRVHVVVFQSLEKNLHNQQCLLAALIVHQIVNL